MGTVPSPPAQANSLTVTALSIITAAMYEIGVLAAGEQPSIDDSAWVLQKLQRLIDRYNAREPMIYSVSFTEFTLPINIQPVTIGPNQANFAVNQRPVKINSGTLILNGGTDSTGQVEVPLFIRDKDWWAQQQIKSLTSTLPTDLYYSPDWPNGSLYFWPIPTAVNNVRLEMRTVLAELTSYNAPFSMPPAYWDAIVYPLAISLCPSFQTQASAELQQLSAQAISAVESNNIQSPRLASDSPSQNSTSRSRPDFNFLTGLNR